MEKVRVNVGTIGHIDHGKTTLTAAILAGGQVVAAPRSLSPRTRFRGEVYVLGKDEGGRHTPYFSGYKPQFFFRTTSVTGELILPEGIEMVMPGEHTTLDVNLDRSIALEAGSRFAIREGGKTVGSGVVLEVIE